jgi:PadR family transcriptional regulator, regulatory protein AphA
MTPGSRKISRQSYIIITFAAPSDLARNLSASIAKHEMRLLAYRQNVLSLPMQRAFRRDNKRPNPYGTEGQEDPYLNLIARFAVEFEQTYLHWLYEALEVVEARQERAPGGEE